MLENARGVRRDYRQALALYRKAADQNLPDAEQEIGYFYQCGFVGSRDYAQAIAWYRRAASHGNSNAENQLGYMAGEGWGQPQDYVEALSWYYKAADHGNADAQENIGYIFQHGTGVQTDYRQAMSWFYKAAAQGNSNAENQLGWMYQFGQGVQPDNGKALAWYRLSADQGNQNGINNLRAFTAILKQQDDSVWDSANASATDPAILQAQRQERIKDLVRHINELDADAAEQDNFADQLEHSGKKNDALGKIFNALGTVGAVQYRQQAQKDRAEAAGLRGQLAQTESQFQFSSNVADP
jgi:TPR repeat protein